MTTLAFIAGFITVGLPAIILLRQSGYVRDHRLRRRRAGSDGRRGGRRIQDGASAPT